MKKTITILLILFSLTIYGQGEKTAMFKSLYFNQEGEVLRTKIDTISSIGLFGIDFYRKQFQTPYNYPKQFINSKYKNETIVIWNDTTKTKDYKQNWTYTSKFDSLSRLTEFGCSSCSICSQLPYNFQIFYDKQNRPIRMEKYHLIGAISTKEAPNEEFIFEYDDNDNIIKLRHLARGKVYKQIVLTFK